MKIPPQLLNRLTQPQAKSQPPWYRIQTRAEAAGEETTEVLIYGYIGDSWFSEATTAASFRRELNDIDTPRIDIHINSPGGDVYEGIAIANAIRQHKARIVVTVDGLAASAASYIAVAGDELVMMPNTQMMIHDAWGICIGNADDMAAAAASLDRDSENIAGFYAKKAGGTTAEWREAMKAETWYSAEEAVDAGLADRVEEETSGDDGETDAKNAFDLSVFNYAGRAAAPAPRIAPRASGATQKPPAAEPAGETNSRKEVPMDLIMEIRNRLGVQADAELDEQGLLDALDEALAEQAEPETPKAAAAPQPPEGTVLLDKSQYDQLQNDAALGRAAHDRQVEEDRVALVNAAVAKGKIPPARKDHWLAQLKADPEGAKATLDSLAEGTIPLVPIGYTGGVDEAGDSDAYPAHWNPRRARA